MNPARVVGWITLTMIALAALGAYEVNSNLSPLKEVSPGTLSYPLPPSQKLPLEVYRANYTTLYPVQINNSALLVNYGDPKVFITQKAGEPIVKIIPIFLALNASLVTPIAYWSGADLAGFYTEQETPSIRYTIEPALPYHNSFVISLPSVTASAYYVSYPPVSNYTGYQVQVAQTVSYEYTSGNTTYLYYQGTITVTLNFALLYGNNPCIYVNPQTYASASGCGGYGKVVVTITANDAPGGSMKSATVFVKVNDEIKWDNITVKRGWFSGSFTVVPTEYQSVNVQNNMTYVNYYLNASVIAQPTPIPPWAVKLPNPAVVYSNNYAQNFVQGPAYFYGLYRFFSAMNSTLAPFFAYMLAESIQLKGLGGEQSYNAAYDALISGSGLQATLQTIPSLIEQFNPNFSFAPMSGEYYEPEHGYEKWSYTIASGFNPPPYLQYIQLNNGKAEIYDPTFNNPSPLPFWFEETYDGYTQSYKPLPTDGQSITFVSFYPATLNAPLGFPEQEEVLTIERYIAPWGNTSQPN